jgi:glutamate racemase
VSDSNASPTPAGDSRAIGIFDSGLGGLTVARAVRRAFPGEPICYLGDTARVPYGTRSPETVQAYTRQNIAFLLSQGVKFIIAACNTVSAAALPYLEEKVEVPVLGVVEMGAEAALASNPKRVGVIGTETTIAIMAYICAIQRRAPSVEVLQQACPLFVPLIENLWLDHPVTRLVIEEYLAPLREAQIDSLILGCTHYPLIRSVLADFFGPAVQLVDSAEAMVLALRQAFASGALLPAEPARREAWKSAYAAAAAQPPTLNGASHCHYFFTDRCNRFQTLVEAFLGEPGTHLEQFSSDVLVEALAQRQNG